jgi:hypothetical protein
MGTNYYAIPEFTRENKKDLYENITLENWDKVRELIPKEIHLGKSSCGWEFLFNHNNWKYFDKSLESLQNFLKRHKLKDEYGKEITYDEFWEVVHNRGDNPINGKIYYNNWKKYNKNWQTKQPEPFDNFTMENAKKNNYHEEYHFGYRFSNNVEFC